MQLKIYIAGRITGEEVEACKKKFAAVEAKLKMLGVDTVINPLHLGIPSTWSWDEARETCLKVLREKSNAIMLLGDWINSIGAMEEYQYARNHGYKIFWEDDTDAIMSLINPKAWADTTAVEFP